MSRPMLEFRLNLYIDLKLKLETQDTQIVFDDNATWHYPYPGLGQAQAGQQFVPY